MKNKKIIVIISVIILLCIFLALSIFIISNKRAKDIEEMPFEERYDGWIDLTELENAKVEDGVKYNTSRKIKKEHVYDAYSFSDAKLYSKDGRSYFEFTITNLNSKREVINYVLDLKFIDKKGNSIHIINFEMPNIKIGESKKFISAAIDLDIINAYDYEVFGF